MQRLTELLLVMEMKAKEPLSEQKEHEGGDYLRQVRAPLFTQSVIPLVNSRIFKMLLVPHEQIEQMKAKTHGVKSGHGDQGERAKASPDFLDQIESPFRKISDRFQRYSTQKIVT